MIPKGFSSLLAPALLARQSCYPLLIFHTTTYKTSRKGQAKVYCKRHRAFPSKRSAYKMLDFHQHLRHTFIHACQYGTPDGHARALVLGWSNAVQLSLAKHVKLTFRAGVCICVLCKLSYAQPFPRRLKCQAICRHPFLTVQVFSFTVGRRGA